MKPVFADTFYWIALTSPAEAAYERANQVTDDIVTIDEVLTEYLTFFSAASEYVRRKGRPDGTHRTKKMSGALQRLRPLGLHIRKSHE